MIYVTLICWGLVAGALAYECNKHPFISWLLGLATGAITVYAIPILKELL